MNGAMKGTDIAAATGRAARRVIAITSISASCGRYLKRLEPWKTSSANP